MKILITYNFLYLPFPSETVSGGEIKFHKCMVETNTKNYTYCEACKIKKKK
jgi:hypothetical protein